NGGGGGGLRLQQRLTIAEFPWPPEPTVWTIRIYQPAPERCQISRGKEISRTSQEQLVIDRTGLLFLTEQLSSMRVMVLLTAGGATALMNLDEDEKGQSRVLLNFKIPAAVG
ncbi:hypothetical protein STAS_02228, partial [Striga asiatica]